MGEHYNRLTQKQISLENQTAIKGLTEKVDSLEKTLTETNNDVKRMLFYFNSDATTKTEGFIEKSNRHDIEIKSIIELISNGKAALWTVGLISSFVTGVVTWFIKLKG